MKKLLSLPVIGIVLAATFAFAPKLTDSWNLFDGRQVDGTADQIKSQYCSGADVETCATQINGSQIVKRP